METNETHHPFLARARVRALSVLHTLAVGQCVSRTYEYKYEYEYEYEYEFEYEYE